MSQGHQKRVKFLLFKRFRIKITLKIEIVQCKEEINIIVKMIKWKILARHAEQYQSSLDLDIALYSSLVKGEHPRCVQL